MSGPTGVPRQRTFDPSQPSRARTPLRPTPRGKALLVALGTLAAPALAVLALAAFGALRDEPESGLGSLPAAEGLQGSTSPTEPPQNGGKPAGGDDEDRTELASDKAPAEGDGGTDPGGKPDREPVLAGCPGGGPQAETSKQRARASRVARSSSDCGGAPDKPERTVDGDVKPDPSAPVAPPEPPDYPDGPDAPDDGDDRGPESPGGSSGSSTP